MSELTGCLKVTRGGRGVIASTTGGATSRASDVTGVAATAFMMETGRVAFVSSPGVRDDAELMAAAVALMKPGRVTWGGGAPWGRAAGPSSKAGSWWRVPWSPRETRRGAAAAVLTARGVSYRAGSERGEPRAPRPLAGGEGRAEGVTHSARCLVGGQLMGVTRSPAHKVLLSFNPLLMITLLLP